MSAYWNAYQIVLSGMPFAEYMRRLMLREERKVMAQKQVGKITVIYSHAMTTEM